ncbi:MAG TPA: AI-2E family transporter [Chondromyces sp.]|nr:AI-2E family transporter [Chondromyces sp.]
MANKRWFQTGVAIIFFLLIILLFREIKDVFKPVFIFIQTLFFPLLAAGVLFYLTRPVVQFLERKKVPRPLAILSVFLLIFITLWILFNIIGPVLNKQVERLVDNVPQMVRTVEGGINYVMENRERLPEFATQTLEQASGKVEDWAVSLGNWLITFVQGLFQFVFLLVLVPFFLFYMLKDREKFAPFVSRFFSNDQRAWIQKTLKDIDNTLHAYVVGQLTVSFFVGVMLFIGYLIIGLDYSLILAFFGMITNVIPFLGPYIAVVPALFVAWVQDPQMVLYVAIIMLVAQQIESNLISPNVMGKALDIHPLTVISLILAAGNIAGVLGVILAIPFYAVVKTIVVNLYRKKSKIKEAVNEEID